AGIQRALAEGAAKIVEAEWVPPQGPRFCEVRHTPEQDEAGRTVRVIGIARDVTEQRRAQEALRHSEQEAKNRLAEVEQIYRYAPIGLFAIDQEYRFTRMNECMAEINGSTVEEHIGKTLWDMVPKLADQLAGVYRPV